MKKERKELRVKPLAPPPEKERITFRLPVPTLAMFRSYLAAYAEIYGEEANPDFVANEILNAFFESDRAFAEYRRKWKVAQAEG